MVIKAPNAIPEFTQDARIVFLAGSIDKGKTYNWQQQVENEFADNERIIILNPRRDDWDENWKETKEDPQFRQQVKWELDAMAKASAIVMYFAPASLSPITLLELGLNAGSGKLVVCCRDGFWRKGNVDIVCERHGIKQVNTIEELIASIYHQ